MTATISKEGVRIESLWVQRRGAMCGRTLGMSRDLSSHWASQQRLALSELEKATGT